MFDAVSSRTISAFPLSVGTSLALESVFTSENPSIDPDRKIPQKINITDYNELWINVGTLFRNLHNAVDRAALKFVRAFDCADALAAEMDFISDLVRVESNGHTSVVFYQSDYTDLTKRFPNGTLRLPRTILQEQYAALYKDTLKVLDQRSKAGRIGDVRKYSSMFSHPGADALIMTHFPVDLLNARKFRSLDLLESHTGLLKKAPEWYTKYYDGRDLNMLPLNGILLTVFGDDHHFRPQPKGMKTALLDLAQEKRWNVLTTPREIVSDIKTIRDHALRDALLVQEQS
jgi:hypothetical protein